MCVWCVVRGHGGRGGEAWNGSQHLLSAAASRGSARHFVLFQTHRGPRRWRSYFLGRDWRHTHSTPSPAPNWSLYKVPRNGFFFPLTSGSRKARFLGARGPLAFIVCSYFTWAVRKLTE